MRWSGPGRWLESQLVDLWQEQNHRRDVTTRVETPIAADLRAFIVMLATILVVIAMRYYGVSGRAGWVADLLGAVQLDGLADRFTAALQESPHRDFNRRAFWAIFRIFVYTVPALLVITFVLKRPVRTFGARVDLSWRHIRPYVGLYLLMVPLVALAATTTDFQEQYPLYEPADGVGLWPRFFIWQALYFGQFLALEFFFRGFVLHGLARRFGFLAVGVMTLPYVAIHFTKPLAEALGSIVAGLVLGAMSLKSGSVWPGAALHFGVALTIDILTLAWG